jgi:hypothetical protein
MSIATFDVETECHEQIGHVVDVGDVRDISQLVHPIGEESRGHQLQHRVLGAWHGDFPGQRSALRAHNHALGGQARHAYQYARAQWP